MDVSFTTVDAVAPPAEIVRVSSPSVSESLIKEMDMVAMPLELITALPLKTPPDTSVLLRPEIEYGTEVPEVRFVVVRVKVAALPSLTEGLLATRE